MPTNPPTEDNTGETARWRLHLCGQAQAVSAQGKRLALERRDAALLALLAIEGPTARTRAMALLWPDEAPEQVRGRLRQRIHALKRRLGVEAIEGNHTLALSTDLPWPGFDQEAPDAPLLGDHDHADMPEFAQWLHAARGRLQGQRRERLAGQASQLEQQGRLAEAIVSAEQLLTFEPLQEHAHRRLMRLHYLRGDRAAALLAFDRCEQALKDEVGATPSTETLELLAQIDRSQPMASTGRNARRIVPASVLRPPRLIGRDAEWAQLQAAWDRGDAIVVIGEAGMGKTRLVSDLVRVQAAAPGSALQVSARPGDERVPYALMSRLLRALLAARSAPLAEGIANELARLLPELPQPAKASSTSDAAAQARFVSAIEATLRQGTESGLQAVVLDDLHFADTASLDMAQHLTATPGVRWLAAFRGSEIGAAAQALVDTLTAALHAEPVVLQPLTSAQVVELIDSLSLDTRDTAALAGALHQRTAGNPLFALETLKALLQQGGSEHMAASPARALAQLPAGGSISRLIERRIGQLSREAVNLARCAAVAGQDFSAALASQVMQTPAIALADAWVELETAQVLRGHAFAHDLIEEAALASVPDSIAKHLHGEVAAWLASQSGEPARIAHHWQQAVQPAHAGPAWLEAAERCAASRRRAEQSQMLVRAAAAFEQAGDRHARCDALLRRAHVVAQYADFESAKRALEDAAHAVIDDEDRLRLVVVSVCARTGHGEDDYALSHAPAAIEMAQRLGRPEQGLLVSMAYGGALARKAADGSAAVGGCACECRSTTRLLERCCAGTRLREPHA
jgi:DNA-binding SARP family transcriptional activator